MDVLILCDHYHWKWDTMLTFDSLSWWWWHFPEDSETHELPQPFDIFDERVVRHDAGIVLCHQTVVLLLDWNGCGHVLLFFVVVFFLQFDDAAVEFFCECQDP